MYIGTQSKCTNALNNGNKAQPLKQLLQTLLLDIAMCTDFPTDVTWMSTMCAVSLANHLRAAADAFCLLEAH